MSFYQFHVEVVMRFQCAWIPLKCCCATACPFCPPIEIFPSSAVPITGWHIQNINLHYQRCPFWNAMLSVPGESRLELCAKSLLISEICSLSTIICLLIMSTVFIGSRHCPTLLPFSFPHQSVRSFVIDYCARMPIVFILQISHYFVLSYSTHLPWLGPTSQITHISVCGLLFCYLWPFFKRFVIIRKRMQFWFCSKFQILLNIVNGSDPNTHLSDTSLITYQ